MCGFTRSTRVWPRNRFSISRVAIHVVEGVPRLPRSPSQVQPPIRRPVEAVGLVGPVGPVGHLDFRSHLPGTERYALGR